MTHFSSPRRAHPVLKSDRATPQLLLESIRVHHGTIDLLPYHQQRIDRSRKVLFPKAPVLKLKKLLESIDLPAEGTYKLRLEYGVALEGFELVPYTVRSIHRIRLVDADELRYGKKFTDRAAIHQLFNKRGDCDDVLMVQRGHLTDTSYANIALFDGDNWYTPAWPVLRGTRRGQLIENGTLRASVIRERDLHNFKTLRMVNAMLPWGEGPEIEVENVVR